MHPLEYIPRDKGWYAKYAARKTSPVYARKHRRSVGG